MSNNEKPLEPEDSMDVTPEQLAQDVINHVKNNPTDRLLVIAIKDLPGDTFDLTRFNSGCSNVETLGYLDVWKTEILSDINGGQIILLGEEPDDDDDGEEWKDGDKEPA